MKKLFLAFALIALLGAGCTTESVGTPDGLTIDDVGVYEAPDNWGRHWNIDQGWSFRYPGEYTADLDFATGIVKVTDRETGAELIHVTYNGEEVFFEEVGENVVWLYEIIGSTKYDN